MTTKLSAFTNQLMNLINNLCKMYPSDPDLQFSKTSVSLMKKTNPRKLQVLFNKYVRQYENQIMSKDEKFLLENNFVEDKQSDMESKADADYAQSIINNLRKYWRSMDDESKTNIWKYLQVLMLLNNKCC